MKNTAYTFLYKMLAGTVCLVLFLISRPTFAQDTTLSRNQLKAYEGVFQNQQNKEMNVRFIADSSSLQAKLLWNGGQLRLYPKSLVDFYSKGGETVNIKFVKGMDGRFNQLSVNGGEELWDRVINYQPLAKKEFPHSPDQLKPFEGLFQLQEDPNRYIQLTAKNNQLILKQHWDGQEVPFVPDSAWDFFNKVQLLFTLHFVKGPDSTIVKVVAFSRDVWNKVQPVAYTPAQLKIFEGKYHLKEDPDDIIQIKASGNNLVVKQLWDGKETALYPVADKYFYNSAKSYPARFLPDDSGAITKVLMLSGDLFEKMKE